SGGPRDHAPESGSIAASCLNTAARTSLRASRKGPSQPFYSMYLSLDLAVHLVSGSFKIELLIHVSARRMGIGVFPRSGRSWRRLILFQSRGHQRLEAGYPVRVRGMIREKLRRLTRTGLRLHPLPEADRLTRVIARARH